MKTIIAFIICCSSTICSADLFDLGIAELCNLINDHALSDMKKVSYPDSNSVACDYSDRNYAHEGSEYNRTFRVLRYFRSPEMANRLFLKFEVVPQKINDPIVRSEYFSILKTLLNGVTSNHKVVDDFILAAENLEPNNAVHVDLDAMSIRAGYWVDTYGTFAFYRLEVQNQCMFSLSDTVNRSKCLSDRTSKAPAIVSTDSVKNIKTDNEE